MNTTVMTKPSLGEDLSRRANTILDFCRNLIIDDDDGFSVADRKASETASLEKGIIEYWKDPKASAYKSWKIICAKESEMLTPIKEGGKELTAKMRMYRMHREKIERTQQEAKQLKRETDARVEAFKLAEQGAPKEVTDAVAKLLSEPVETSSTQELRSKTSFALDYEVRVIKGKEHLIPAEILKPTTPQMVKALEAKVKKLAKLTGGEQIPGLEIIQTETARRRQI